MVKEVSPELQAMPVGFLEQNVALARAALEIRLQTPAEQEILRGVQVDATKAIAEALAQRKDAFHLDEATGVGKTAIGLQFANTVMPGLGKDGHGRAIFVAPTLDIVNQTVEAAATFAPDLTVSAYSSMGRNLDGDLIVTTYNSLGEVIKRLRYEKAQDVRLLIADEFHKGQGEQRTASLPEIPQAILLGLSATPDARTVTEMVHQGKVEGDARWVKMFTDGIHEVDLSEAVGDILAPLSVRIIETELDATNITIEGNGTYNPEQIEAFARTIGRSLMGLALFKGPQVLIERGIRVPAKQLEELEAAHRELQGRNVLIFAQSIDHADDITLMLQQEGVKAESYHSKVGESTRERLRKSGFGDDTYRVLVGVRNALGEGIDLPEADAAIFLDVTRDPLGLEQKLGRILRPLPGKTALAIQLKDKFHRGHQPVLIPQLFSRDAIALNQRRALGTVRRRNADGGEIAERPRITFTGVDMQAYFQQVDFERVVQTGITQAESIEELDNNLTTILDGVASDIGVVSAVEYYQAIVDVLPSRLPEKINQMVFSSAMAGDARGARALLFLNMKTILTLVNKFGEGDEEDLIQEAAMAFMERYTTLNPNLRISHAVYQLVESALSEYISDREFMEVVGWVKDGSYTRIKRLAEEYLAEKADPIMVKPQEFVALVHQVIPEYSGADSSLVTYLRTKDAMDRWEERLLAGREARTIDFGVVREVMNDFLEAREITILDLRFGMADATEYTLEQVGRQLVISRDRVRQIETRALRKLRHPEALRRLNEVR